MPREDWIENTVERIFEREGFYPSGLVSSVLDVACGLSLKSQFITADIRVGVDIYRPYLEKIETDVPYVAVNANALEIETLFLPKSFDLVMVLDVVEHMEKEDGLRLLAMAETIARRAVVVETPYGYVPQNIDIWGHGGDEWQTHRSGWLPDEFLDLGYTSVVRDYTMSNVKRHTEVEVAPEIRMIDAIKRLDLVDWSPSVVDRSGKS